MKRLCFLLLATLSFVSAGKTDDYTAYISKYSQIAVDEMIRSGVPASITLAQGLLESGAGKSALAIKANNHFGIKCHIGWHGKKYYQDDDSKGECFRVYSSPEGSFADHSDFLRYRDRYKSLFELDPSDYKAWAKGLKAAGYATDPSYAGKLVKIIEKYNLSKYDVLQSSDSIPASPASLETPVKVPVGYSEEIKVNMELPVYSVNGIRFVYASKGQTYAGIAAMWNLFPSELLRYNDLKEERPLAEGEMVYIQLKKPGAAKGVEKYVVDGPGVSLWTVAQRYGVRLKALKKLNPKLVECAGNLPEGEVVKLRK